MVHKHLKVSSLVTFNKIQKIKQTTKKKMQILCISSTTVAEVISADLPLNTHANNYLPHCTCNGRKGWHAILTTRADCNIWIKHLMTGLTGKFMAIIVNQ